MGGLWREPRDPDVLRYREIRCPACDKPLDAAAAASGRTLRAPEPGDFAICFGCAEPAVFTVDALGTVGLRAPTAAERAECVREHAKHIDRLKTYIARGRRPG